ncbi:MAG: Rpn family recombination-promoting nuclease/putative transposase [Victivallales bacterium]|nr:Rpn family recombination-promoting nuclease/putative transposase [Victivallales bacterium]
MGIKDAVAKMFFGQKEIMADLLNHCLFNNWPIVKEKHLTLLEGGSYKIIQDNDGKLRTDNRFSDLFARCDIKLNGEDWCYLVGIELQSRSDCNMIPRIMEYDARRYRRQLAEANGEKRLLRIINITINFDKRKRKCASRLSDYIQPTHLNLAGKFFDYGHICLNIYDLAEKSDEMRCKDFRYMLNCFKNDQEGRSFENALLDNGRITSVSRTIRLMQYVFLGLKGWVGNEDEYNENEEECGMCKALSDIKKKAKKEGKAEGIAEGKAEGIAEGIVEGEENAIKKVILTLLEMSYKLVDICTITGATEAKVREVAVEANFTI